MGSPTKRWKAVLGDWTFIQTLLDTGSLLCLTEQERSTLQTFLIPAYWPTRWQNSPGRDVLEAFCAEIERKLMEDCTLSLVQIGCTVNLVLNGVVISSMPFDAEQCELLGGADGKGSGDYELEAQAEEVEDKKTELFSGAMALVKYCSEAVSDFFDAIDAEIELGLAATVWMEAVPGLDMSPANEVLQAADALNDMLRASFLAADTPEWREQESCKIMCWCVYNGFTFDASICDLWREDLYGYGVSFPHQGYWQIVNVLTNRAMINRFALGMNDEDEDWIILCDECYEACGILTFDDVETDLDYEIDMGTVVDNGNPDDCINGEFFASPPTNPYGRKFIITLELPELTTVGKLVWDSYVVKPGGAGPDLARQVEFLDADETVLETWEENSQPPISEWYEEEMQGASIEGVKFVRMTVNYVTQYSGTHEIRADNITVMCPSE